MKKIVLFLLSLAVTISPPIYAATSTTQVAITSSPSLVEAGKEFTVSVSLSRNTSTPILYRLKGRIGTSSATLSSGETQNASQSAWLSDTSSWDDFPALTLTSLASVSGTLTLRVKSTVAPGNYILAVRIKGDTTYDSVPVSLQVATPSATPIPTPTPSPSPEITPSTTLTPTPTPSPVSNVYISEVMTSPQTGEHEWIELFNNNDKAVTLTNWKYDDSEGGSTPHLFSMTIDPYAYGVVMATTSLFNNDGDQVRILNADEEVKDSLSYTDSSKGLTFSRLSFDSTQVCLTLPTPLVENGPCIASDETLNSSPTASQTPTPTPTPLLSLSSSPQNEPRVSSPLSLPQTSLPPLIQGGDDSDAILSETVPQVLGTSQINPEEAQKKAKMMMIVSVCYSLLTLSFFFFRMKIIHKN